MSKAASAGLRALRRHPFELLQEMERRGKAALAGASGEDVDVAEWVGIGFRLAGDQFVVARHEIRELLMVPPAVTRVPGAKAWVRGIANVRGQLLPIADLRAYLGSGTAGGDRNARVMVVNGPEFSVGLVVDEVYGFRRFLQNEHSGAAVDTKVRAERLLHGVYERGGEKWPVFSVAKLLESPEFAQAAEL